MIGDIVDAFRFSLKRLRGKAGIRAILAFALAAMRY
jgi:hypothetical protein